MFPCFAARCISRSYPSIINTPSYRIHTEKVGPPNILLGGLMKYGTIVAGAYVFLQSAKMLLDQDTQGNVLNKALQILNTNPEATECLGKDIRQEIAASNKVFEYPENGVLKMYMTIRIVGSKERGTFYVQAHQNDKKKRFRFNWMYDSLNVHLDDGKVLQIEIK